MWHDTAVWTALTRKTERTCSQLARGVSWCGRPGDEGRTHGEADEGTVLRRAGQVVEQLHPVDTASALPMSVSSALVVGGATERTTHMAMLRRTPT